MPWFDFLRASNDRITASGGLRSDARGMLVRLRGVLPDEWFPDEAPTLDALLGGAVDGLVFGRQFIAYAQLQTRIATATGFWLDLAAWDYFGPRFRRRRGEPDDAFRPRLLAEILRPRNTRRAIIRAVKDLTGVAPRVREPWNPAHNGAWGRRMAWRGPAVAAIRVSGYNVARSAYGRGTFAYTTARHAQGGSLGAGHWGSHAMRNQLFVQARRGNVGLKVSGRAGGWSNARTAWGTSTALHPGHGFYSRANGQEALTDAEIYATIAATAAGGVIAWTNIAP